MRYFYRRAYYIAYIAANIQTEVGDAMGLSFESLNENPLLPILVLSPRSKAKTDGQKSKKSSQSYNFVIRIIPCAPEDLFPRSKLSPNANCNRGEEVGQQSGKQVTPFYNSTLHAEGTFIQYLRLLTQARKECPSFADACVLGRIWLQQRGFGGKMSRGGFGHFEWAVMIALLMQIGGRNGKPALTTSLSGAELFKAAIQFLSSTDFNKRPSTFGVSSMDPDLVKESGPVLFDPTRQLNLLIKMTPWSASLLQMHAKSAADLLADDGADTFEPTFIVKSDAPLQIFDDIFEMRPLDVQSKSPDRRGRLHDFSFEAHRVLRRGFGNRAQLIHIQHTEASSWALDVPRAPPPGSVIVGVIFDPANMSRQMELGPPAEEEKEAARFRQFWGRRAELRRFKDGSILECVEWSSRGAADICEEIARDVLGRHLKVAKDQLSFFGRTLSAVLDLSHVDKDAFDSARQSFQAFEQNIRDLADLPLEVRQLSPISEMARYSSIKPPRIGFHSGFIEPMDVNIYFEASSRWPENLVAIQQAKVEFLLDLDKRLVAAHDNITTYLGRENRDDGIENAAYLDVVYDNGSTFRLRIHCELEETLLERQAKNKMVDHHVREQAEDALADVRWLYTTLPIHTQTIATFCTRLPPLSPAIRLVKQWFNSHKLAGHLSEELVELFVLHVFLQPYPWRLPSSARTGFLRTLNFLSRWDWRGEPLIVDSADELSADERFAVHRELETWRKRDPNMNHTVMLVATSHDRTGLAYTRRGPSKLTASRMTRLAKAAAKLIKDQGIHLDVPELFRTSLQDYDVLIHLSPKAVKAAARDAAAEPGARGQRSHYKNLERDPLPLRAHPADVLAAELQRAYADTLVFFRGAADDAVVGAVWNPRLQRQKFRAGLPYNFARVRGEDADVVEVNRRAVLLEIARVGGDMIRKIEEVEE